MYFICISFISRIYFQLCLYNYVQPEAKTVFISDRPNSVSAECSAEYSAEYSASASASVNVAELAIFG